MSAEKQVFAYSKDGLVGKFNSLSDAKRNGHDRGLVANAIATGGMFHGYYWSHKLLDVDTLDFND